MKKYAVVIERGRSNLSAYIPDLPGCVTTGKTIEEIERKISVRQSSFTPREYWKTETRFQNPLPQFRMSSCSLHEWPSDAVWQRGEKPSG